MGISGSNRRSFVPLLVLISLLGLCSLTKARVALIGYNFSFSFDDIEAIFAPTVKGSGICGELHLAEPLNACMELNNVVEQEENSTAPFVLIIRGGCSFEDKVWKAQKAGFKAAIVYDNEDGILVAMAGNSAGIQIPAVFISKQSGETLKKFAGFHDMELWILPNFGDSAWSIMAISFISLLAMSAMLATCFLVRRHRIRRQQAPSPRVREFHGMSKHLVTAMPSLIFTAVLEDNCTSSTCAICLEDYKVGEKLRILPCHHKFHAFCVDAWLTTWRTFCPVCKRDARTSTGIPPASESTPLLLSYPVFADSSSLLSSFRSSLHSASAIQIPSASASASFHSPSRGHSLASTPAGQQSFRSYRHSPPISINRSSADLRFTSSRRSSHLASPHSMGYPSISPSSSIYISPYESQSIIGSSSGHQNPLYCNESAASFSASANSLPEC